MQANTGIFNAITEGITIFAKISPTEEKSTLSRAAIRKTTTISITDKIIADVRYVCPIGFLDVFPVSVARNIPNISS